MSDVQVLEAGGNAVDAAVAVGFALAVTHPSARATSAAADSCWCGWPTGAPPSSISASGRRRRPRATCIWTPPASRPGTAWSVIAPSGVPGTVRGIEYASKKYGRKPWADLVAPAVELAEKGFALSVRAGAVAAAAAPRAWAQFPGIEAHLSARRQATMKPGDNVCAARTGAHAGAHPRRAPAISTKARPPHLLAADMESHGGLITLADLKDYTAVERTAADRHLSRLRHHHLASAQFRRAGILQMLGVLEGTGYEKSGAGSAARTALHGGSHAPLFRRPRRIPGRSGFREGAARRPARPGYISQLRKSIDPEQATPSSQVQAASCPATKAADHALLHRGCARATRWR